LTRKLEVPSFDPSKEEPPAELPLEFRFDSSVRRTLSVLGTGRPLTPATVDVESIANLDSDQRQALNTYAIPADGLLQLLGGGDQMVEVFVYAKGFEPRRAIWNAGAPLVVDLTARDSSFEFPVSASAVVARIRKAGSPRAVRTVVLNASQKTLAPVEPGSYDITCYSESGATVGYQRLDVAVGTTVAWWINGQDWLCTSLGKTGVWLSLNLRHAAGPQGGY
jgi:hypothetical protein